MARNVTAFNWPLAVVKVLSEEVDNGREACSAVKGDTAPIYAAKVELRRETAASIGGWAFFQKL